MCAEFLKNHHKQYMMVEKLYNLALKSYYVHILQFIWCELLDLAVN